MQLPIFYVPEIAPDKVVLDEDTSKHVVQVLRMVKGEELLITDGNGKRARASIVDDHRKRCEIKIGELSSEEKPSDDITIAISILKNTSRFEWFLEKATELGINSIIPMICDRTEKERFRHDRLQSIIISAMLQSHQIWLPVLHPPAPFDTVLKITGTMKYIAHCMNGAKIPLTAFGRRKRSLILIGPEGDFTTSELERALSKGYQPVTLGHTRLRTETAGIVAATLLMHQNLTPAT